MEIIIFALVMYAHQTYDYAKVVTILIQVAILGQYYFYLTHKSMSIYFYGNKIWVSF